MKYLAPALLGLVAACQPGGSYGADWTYTSTGRPATALAAGCPVQVYLTPPTRAYTELGVVDWTGPDDPGPPQDPNVFASDVAELVCAAGGNAVIAPNQGSAESWFSYPQGIVIDVTGP